MPGTKYMPTGCLCFYLLRAMCTTAVVQVTVRYPLLIPQECRQYRVVSITDDSKVDSTHAMETVTPDADVSTGGQ